MTCEGEERRKEPRKGPSNMTISVGGIIGILGLAASGVATYNAVQNDIASLKRGEMYQERTNDRLSDEMKAMRVEHREALHQFNDKLDRLIEQWPNRRR